MGKGWWLERKAPAGRNGGGGQKKRAAGSRRVALREMVGKLGHGSGRGGR